MADPEINSYDGKILGNVLILGGTASGKTTLVEKMASNSMFGKLEGTHWISVVKLSKEKEAVIDFYFESKVEFYNPVDEYDLRKTFADLENLYREKLEKKNIATASGVNAKEEYVERDNLIVLGDASSLEEWSHSFVTFLTTCRKFGYSVLYIFHENASSGPRWEDIVSQTQIFCVFPSAMD